MILRNRELFRAIAATLLLSCVIAAVAYALGGPRAAATAAVASLVAPLPLLISTLRRYRAIARMTSQVDAVLHGERGIVLGSMNEGELSMLASELDKMIERLNHTADELERKTVALSDSLADISHQLKTPMTSLGIITELVWRRVADRREELTAEDVEEVLARLRQAQQLQERVKWLVQALLKLARIDAGVVRLAELPVDANEVVRTAANSLAVAFDLADVELLVEECPGAMYKGDALWSAEAVENVLKNCMEHTPAGGRVRVWIEDDPLGCRIHVEDTGAGIAEKDLPHVFERFYRGDDERKGAPATSLVDPAGVGIGLSLARSLVMSQGGAVEARNAVGPDGRITGARFDLVFFKVII